MRYFWLLLFLVACAPKVSTFPMYDLQGEVVGDVFIEEVREGVRLSLVVGNIPRGVHALHVHEFGVCEGDFSSAGAHFNPNRNQHGKDNPLGKHAGDLPNIFVRPDGTGEYSMIVSGVTLAKSSIRGKSLILHEGADDFKSDPSGNAGARIVCGVIS